MSIISMADHLVGVSVLEIEKGYSIKFEEQKKRSKKKTDKGIVIWYW